MRSITAILLACLAAVVSGCAAHPDPIIDMKGVDQERYEEDWVECESYTEEVVVAKGVANGAGLGAAVGGAAGAIGGNSSDVAEGAAYGAALLAGVGAGIWSDVSKAAEVVQLEGETHPGTDVEAYQNIYNIYRSLYPTLKETFATLSTYS